MKTLEEKAAAAAKLAFKVQSGDGEPRVDLHLSEASLAGIILAVLQLEHEAHQAELARCRRTIRRLEDDLEDLLEPGE